MAGAQSPPVEAKAGGRLGSRVSRMQCASGRHTEDPEWGAGARQLAPLRPHVHEARGHRATGPHYTGADVLGVIRTVRSVPREVTANPSSDSRSQSQADTGNRASGSLTWGWRVSPSGTAAGPARGRLRSVSPLRGFLLRPVLARPGFLGTRRRRAGLSVGAATPRLMGLLALVGLAVTDLQGWPSGSRVLTSMVLGADQRRRPCRTLARSRDRERPEPEAAPDRCGTPATGQRSSTEPAHSTAFSWPRFISFIKTKREIFELIDFFPTAKAAHTVLFKKHSPRRIPRARALHVRARLRPTGLARRGSRRQPPPPHLAAAVATVSPFALLQLGVGASFVAGTGTVLGPVWPLCLLGDAWACSAATHSWCRDGKLSPPGPGPHALLCTLPERSRPDPGAQQPP